VVLIVNSVQILADCPEALAPDLLDSLLVLLRQP
jgi:hypothetical protein